MCVWFKTIFSTVSSFSTTDWLLRAGRRLPCGMHHSSWMYHGHDWHRQRDKFPQVPTANIAEFPTLHCRRWFFLRGGHVLFFILFLFFTYDFCINLQGHFVWMSVSLYYGWMMNGSFIDSHFTPEPLGVESDPKAELRKTVQTAFNEKFGTYISLIFTGQAWHHGHCTHAITYVHTCAYTSVCLCLHVIIDVAHVWPGRMFHFL